MNKDKAWRGHFHVGTSLETVVATTMPSYSFKFTPPRSPSFPRSRRLLPYPSPFFLIAKQTKPIRNAGVAGFRSCQPRRPRCCCFSTPPLVPLPELRRSQPCAGAGVSVTVGP